MFSRRRIYLHPHKSFPATGFALTLVRPTRKFERLLIIPVSCRPMGRRSQTLPRPFRPASSYHPPGGDNA